MRTLYVVIAMALFAITHPALAESKWLESRHLETPEIKVLCERVNDVRLLARMQMMTVGKADWLRLARQELVIEGAVMGAPPLDPGRCYVIARAGRDDERTRRAFEVRDFAVGPDRTSVFVVGRSFDPPPR